MEMGDSDLLFIDVDASTPAVKQEQEEAPEPTAGLRRMPSEAQVRFLVDCMEKYPELARGCIRSAGRRARARRVWEQLRLRLHATPGARKTCSQWMKYWSDKKTFIKKKAAEGEAELTAMEEKILYLCAGVSEPAKVKRSSEDRDPHGHSDLSDADGQHTPNVSSWGAPTGHNKPTDSKSRTPSQNGQSSFDRILKIEERRLSTEQSNAQLMRTILEQSAEKERTILSAVRSLNDRLSERNERDKEMAGALKVLGEGDTRRAKRARPAPELRFKCSSCAYVTYHRALFREHRNRHDGIKPYKCELCPYSSVSKKYARQHQARHRACACGHLARNGKQLRRHLAACAGAGGGCGGTGAGAGAEGGTGGAGPVFCTRCRREYVDEQALAKHSARATSCPLCGAALCAGAGAGPGSLRAHLARAHDVTPRATRADRTPFECGACGWRGGAARGVLLHLIHHPQRAPALDTAVLTRCGILT